MLFGCPQCDRAYTDRPGYTSIPSIKRWPGKLDLFTDEEMAQRQEDRKFVIARLRAGRRGARLDGVEGIGRIGAEELMREHMGMVVK